MRSGTKLFCCLLTMILMAMPGRSADEKIAAVGLCKSVPVIDGQPDDQGWENSMEITGFVTPVTTDYVGEQTSLRLCRDASTLYGLVVCNQAGADKMPAGTIQRDADTIWMGDGVEMFFINEKLKDKWYQIIINPDGSVYDVEYHMQGKKKTSNLAWNSDIKVKTVKLQNKWIIEFALPLSDLGGPPADGESWKFNIVRNNKARDEYSSWARFLELDWCQPDKFNRLAFFNSIICGMTFDGLPGLTPQSSFKLEFRDIQGGKYEAKLEGANIAEKMIRRQLDPAAGGKQVIEFKYDVLPASSGLTNSLALEINRENRMLYKFIYAPEREHIAVYPGFVGTDKTLYLSPDWEAVIYWDMRHSFPGGNNLSANGKIQMDYEILFEVPEGIVVADANAKQTGTVTHGGEKLVTWSLAEKFAFNAVGQRQATLTTTLPEGRKGSIFFYAKWNKGAQPKQILDFEVIKIRKTIPPARFITGSYGLYTPPVEKALRYKELGINTLSSRASGKEHIKLVNDLKKAGFYVRRGDYYFPGMQSSGALHPFSMWTDKDPDARALDLDGHYIPGRDGYYQLSPSYRGSLFEKGIEEEKAFIKETGLNWFAFDMEDYIMPNGQMACFHPRTIEKFKEYFIQKYPDKKYVDPREFEKDPKKMPDYHSIWVDFKCWIWADFFREFKNRLKDVVGKTTPWDGVIISEWPFNVSIDEEQRNKWLRGREFADVFDFFEVHAYYDVNYFVQDHAKRLIDFKKDFPAQKSKFIVCPIPQRFPRENIDAPELPAELKYKIFESAAFGAKGIFAWTSCMFNIASFKHWCDGIAAVKKVEDIVLDGERIEQITSSNDKIRVHGMKLGNRAVVCVSEYLALKPMTAKIKYAVKDKNRVIDLENDKVIAGIDAKNGEFEITLDAARARLLLIEPETEKARQ